MSVCACVFVPRMHVSCGRGLLLLHLECLLVREGLGLECRVELACAIEVVPVCRMPVRAGVRGKRLIGRLSGMCSEAGCMVVVVVVVACHCSCWW